MQRNAIMEHESRNTAHTALTRSEFVDVVVSTIVLAGEIGYAETALGAATWLRSRKNRVCITGECQLWFAKNQRKEMP
jgi:hypothetical protein